MYVYNFHALQACILHVHCTTYTVHIEHVQIKFSIKNLKIIYSLEYIDWLVNSVRRLDIVLPAAISSSACDRKGKVGLTFSGHTWMLQAMTQCYLIL